MTHGLRRVGKGFALLAFLAAGLVAAENASAVWRLDDVARVGGRATEVLGAPRVVEGVAVFDGKADGVFVPAIPIAGAGLRTIEVWFKPASGGAKEQRFFHLEDTAGRRALFETRLDEKGGWWLDVHVRMGAQGRFVTLIEPKLTHPVDQWYWVAMRYDGKTLTSFVNGVKELESPANFEPFADGKVSVGVRQNRVYWFSAVFTRGAGGGETAAGDVTGF